MSTSTTTSTAEKAATAIEALNTIVLGLNQELEVANQRCADLLLQRDKLYNQPLGSAEIRQFVSEMIDYRTAQYVERLREFGLADKLARPTGRDADPAARSRYGHRPPLNFEDAEYALGRGRGNESRKDLLNERGWLLPVFLSEGEFRQWPYFFFGEIMKDKLIALLADMQPAPSTDGGAVVPSLGARREQLAAINAELLELGAQIGRIQSEIDRITRPVLAGAKGLASVATGAA